MEVVVGVLVVGGISSAVTSHQRERRTQRLSKAVKVLTQLAQGGCDLNCFQKVCKKAQDGVVKQREVLALSSDATILENAKYIIGLYARSATTRDLVDRAGAIGTIEFLRELEMAIARQRLSLLVEAGFDLAALLHVAEEARANGWGDDDLLNALAILCDGNSAKKALVSVARELIESCAANADIASLCENISSGAEVLADVAEEVTGTFLDALFE